MAYNKTIWENDITPIDADKMNNIENGIEEAYNAVNGSSSMGNIVVESIKHENLFDKTKTTSNKYIGADGGTLEQDGVSYSDYIKVEPNKTYYIEDRGVWTSIALYDNNKVFKNRVAINKGVYSVPDDIHYMICNIDSTKINEFEVCLHPDNKEHYTEQEQIIGTWLGVKLYRKVINIGVIPNQNTKTIGSGLTNESIVKIYGIAKNSDGYCLPLPYTNSSSQNDIRVTYSKANHAVEVITTSNMSAYSGYAIIEYTK